MGRPQLGLQCLRLVAGIATGIAVVPDLRRGARSPSHPGFSPVQILLANP